MCPIKFRTKTSDFHVLKIDRIMPFCNLIIEQPSYNFRFLQCYILAELLMLVIVIIHCGTVCGVFSRYRYFFNCVYELASRNCSEPVAHFVISFILIGQRPYFSHYAGCDLANISKSIRMFSVAMLGHSVDHWRSQDF